MKKRLLSTIMCGFIAFQAVPVSADDAASADLAVEEEIEDGASESSVSGGASNSDEASELITYTKKLFGIGPEYDEFDYTYSAAKDSGITIYSFKWKNSETGLSVNAEVGSSRYMYSYNKSEGNTSGSKLGTVTKQEAKTSADSFLSLVVPSEYIDDIKYIKINSKSTSDRYTVSYQYTVNNIPVEDAYFNVYVSKFSGNVVYYSAPSSCPFDYDYPKPENIISAEEAHENYREYCTFDFGYSGHYDSEAKMYSAFPCYSVRNITALKIDAFTGKGLSYYSDDVMEAGGNVVSSSSFDLAEEETADEEDEYKLTEAEIASMEEKDDLMTAEEALAVIEKEVKIEDKTNLYSKLWKENTGEYRWSIQINNDNTDISAYINASTGEVTYYSNGKSTDLLSKDEESLKPDYNDMLEAAERILSSFSVGKADSVKLEYNSYEDKDFGIYSYSFNYIRTVNGIEYRNNSIIISFDAKGTFDYYNCTWYNNINFEDTEGAIDTDAAYDKMFEAVPPVLTYVNTKTGMSLAYVFGYNGVYLDKYGNRVDYKGNPYEEDEDFNGYIDIEGSKYEDIIKLLYNNGYYIERDEFKPNEPISPEDFASFFKLKGSLTEQGWRFNSLDINGKYYGESLTRYETAEILAGLKADKKLLEAPEIFDVSYYKDEIDESYKAAVALCYGLGYMKGDDKDCFNGETLLTNGEAAKVLYNYLINR